MKSLKKLLLPIVLLVFTVGILAQPGPGMGMGKGKAMMSEKLNLTADQQKKIEDLRTNHQKKMIDLRATIAKLHIEKKELLNKGNYDRKSFLALEEKIMKQNDIIEMSRKNHQMDVYEVLDAAQKEIWNKRPMRAGKGFHGKRMERNKRIHDCPNGCGEVGPGPRGNGFHGGM